METRKIELNYRGGQRMNSHYSMMIQWSETEQLFLVHLPDFPPQQFVTHGTTYEMVARNGQEVLAMIIEEYIEEGKVLPEPQVLRAQAA
jgi:predicted RNase H-like HicB family nuclease